MTQPEIWLMRRKRMKTNSRKFAPAFGSLVVALLLTPFSRAACGGIDLTKVLHTPAVHPQAIEPASQLARFGIAGEGERGSNTDPAIVGFWHVKFVSEGSTGIPDDLEIDAGYAQWHSDGTENMNSAGRAPVTSSFCLGVWKSVGYHSYKLNHFAASWDPTPATNTPNGTLLGPAQIQEEITLSPGENKFSGTFTIDQYDTSGNNIAHVQGTITGTRITADTAVSSIF
jgi:hypothetical protein